MAVFDDDSNRFLRRDFLKAAAATALPLICACGSSHTDTKGAPGSSASPSTAATSGGEPLVVGGLPVTCNLTLPVACSARAAAQGGQRPFEYSKYSGWPEIKESLMSGRIQAAFMLAPLVMDLTTKKIPVKIVSLGHRSGAVIMVRTDSKTQTFK